MKTSTDVSDRSMTKVKSALGSARACPCAAQDTMMLVDAATITPRHALTLDLTRLTKNTLPFALSEDDS